MHEKDLAIHLFKQLGQQRLLKANSTGKHQHRCASEGEEARRTPGRAWQKLGQEVIEAGTLQRRLRLDRADQQDRRLAPSWLSRRGRRALPNLSAVCFNVLPGYHDYKHPVRVALHQWLAIRVGRLHQNWRLHPFEDYTNEHHRSTDESSVYLLHLDDCSDRVRDYYDLQIHHEMVSAKVIADSRHLRRV